MRCARHGTTEYVESVGNLREIGSIWRSIRQEMVNTETWCSEGKEEGPELADAFFVLL
jgi:hypothetical protein